MSPTLISAVAARPGEFAQRHAAFGLQPDVDDGDVLLDADDRAFDDGTFLQMAVAERFIDHAGEIFARRRGGSNLSHEHSEPRGMKLIPNARQPPADAGGWGQCHTIGTKAAVRRRTCEARERA